MRSAGAKSRFVELLLRHLGQIIVASAELQIAVERMPGRMVVLEDIKLVIGYMSASAKSELQGKSSRIGHWAS